MKILYIYNAVARWGGIERVLADKVNLLVNMYGYQVFLITTDQGSHSIPFEMDSRIIHRDLGICFHLQYQYPFLKSLIVRIQKRCQFKRRLLSQLRDIMPDIIIGSSANFVADINAVRGNVPFLVESHSGFHHPIEYERLTLVHKLKMRLIYRNISKATCVVSLTEEDANCWRKVCKTVTIPNIVHLNSTNCYSTCENKRIIFVGRFASQKGIPDLLAIWKIIHEKYPDWCLDMYGEGEYKENFQKQIDALNANIHVFDPVSNIHQHYIESSIFVLTSVYEPFGLVMVEAMSCGIPVVSFDCPYGPQSIITNGKDGFLVKNRSIVDFANRVCKLIENVGLRQEMGYNAMNSAQRYNAENIMPLWNNLFETIVNGN